MPAAESQKSANVNAAVLLGMSDKIEALEKGKLADITALDENPLQHINLAKRSVCHKGLHRL